jgi:hypothetical protein
MNFKRMRRIERLTAVLVLVTGPLALMRAVQAGQTTEPPAPTLIGKGGGGGTGSGYAAEGADGTHP